MLIFLPAPCPDKCEFSLFRSLQTNQEQEKETSRGDQRAFLCPPSIQFESEFQIFQPRVIFQTDAQIRPTIRQHLSV